MAFQRELWKEKSDESMTALEKAGVKIYKVDPQPFVDAVQPMIRKLDGTPVGKLIEEIGKIP